MRAGFKLLRTSTFRLAALYLAVFALSVGALLGYGCLCTDRLIFPRPPVSYRDGPSILKFRSADGTALSARWLFGWMRLPSDAEGMALRGFALGTASHGIGAAHALQVHAEAGAYAGLALGVQVVLAAVLMPLVFRWL